MRDNNIKGVEMKNKSWNKACKLCKANKALRKAKKRLKKLRAKRARKNVEFWFKTDAWSIS